MARRRSFKVAPGVRISASGRGIRTSIGNNTARVSFGGGQTYTSAKLGPVRVAQYHGGRSASTSSSASRSGGGRATLTQLERAQKARALEEQIAELAAIEQALVTRHLEEFPPTTPPMVAPPAPLDVEKVVKDWRRQAAKGISFFNRAAIKAARQEAEDAARSEVARIDAENHQTYLALVQQARAEWERFLDHDADLVLTVLEQALADNESDATCVDVGVEDGIRYATVAITVGPASTIPDRTPSVTPGGKPTTRKRSKTDRNTLYVHALGSAVLATIKEAFAVVPSLDEARVLVIRRDPAPATPADHITLIYCGEFDRQRTQTLSWHALNPSEELLTATDAQLQRKGVAGDVVAIPLTDPDMADLVNSFAAAMTVA